MSFLKFAGGPDPQPKTSKIKVLASKSLKSKNRRRGSLPRPRGPGGWEAVTYTCHWHLPLALATGPRQPYSIPRPAAARTLPHDSKSRRKQFIALLPRRVITVQGVEDVRGCPPRSVANSTSNLNYSAMIRWNFLKDLCLRETYLSFVHAKY